MKGLTVQQRIKNACKNNEGIHLSVDDVRMLYDNLFYNQWISVEDALPENGEDVLVAEGALFCTYKDGNFYSECYEHDTGHSYSESVDVKYWTRKGGLQ